MTKVITKTYSVAREYNALITQTLLFGVLIMAFVYAMNVYSIISRTVAIKNIESQTVKVQSQVQDLDTKYITLSNKITPDMAKNFGLVEGEVSAYIERTPSLGSAQGLGALARDL